MGSNLSPKNKMTQFKTFKVCYKSRFASSAKFVKARDISSAVKKLGIPENKVNRVEVV